MRADDRDRLARDDVPPPERDDPDERDDRLDREDAVDRAEDEDAARVPRERDDVAAGLRRSAAGISSVTTAFVSCGISFSRKFAMRSSWRRYSRASFAVSASFSDSASVSIAV